MSVRALAWSLCALAFGCSADDSPDSSAREIERADAAASARSPAARVKLDRPDDGVQLVTRGRTVAAGADEEWCEVVELPGSPDEVLFIGRTELAMTPFSHHLIVEMAPPGSSSLVDAELGVPERCPGPHRYGSDLMPLAASSQPYVSRSYPDGVGLVVRGGQRLLFDYHALNTSEAPIAVQHRLNLHFVGAIEKPARTFGFYNQWFAIAPHTTPTFADECRFKNDLRIWSLVRHTHRLGTDFRVFWAGGEHDGELIWTSRDWELEVTHDLDAPVFVPAGTGFRWECDFHNPGDDTIVFGPQATDEMCILFGDFAAVDDDAAVGPQSCYRFEPP